jgi:hypothetical protein
VVVQDTFYTGEHGNETSKFMKGVKCCTRWAPYPWHLKKIYCIVDTKLILIQYLDIWENSFDGGSAYRKASTCTQLHYLVSVS